MTATSTDGQTGTASISYSVVTSSSSSLLTTSANPSAYDTAVTLTDTVTGDASPTGLVTFTDTTGGGDAVISGCGSVALMPTTAPNSTATCSYTPPATDNVGGAFTVVATYLGSNTYSGSTSNTLTQDVNGYQSTNITLTFGANPISHGSSVSVNATVSDPTGRGTPTGTVTFYDLTDDTTICTRTVPALGLGHRVVPLHPAGPRRDGRGVLDRRRLLGRLPLRPLVQPRVGDRAGHRPDHLVDVGLGQPGGRRASPSPSRPRWPVPGPRRPGT